MAPTWQGTTGPQDCRLTTGSKAGAQPRARARCAEPGRGIEAAEGQPKATARCREDIPPEASARSCRPVSAVINAVWGRPRDKASSGGSWRCRLVRRHSARSAAACSLSSACARGAARRCACLASGVRQARQSRETTAETADRMAAWVIGITWACCQSTSRSWPSHPPATPPPGEQLLRSAVSHLHCALLYQQLTQAAGDGLQDRGQVGGGAAALRLRCCRRGSELKGWDWNSGRHRWGGAIKNRSWPNGRVVEGQRGTNRPSTRPARACPPACRSHAAKRSTPHPHPGGEGAAAARGDRSGQTTRPAPRASADSC